MTKSSNDQFGNTMRSARRFAWDAVLAMEVGDVLKGFTVVPDQGFIREHICDELMKIEGMSLDRANKTADTIYQKAHNRMVEATTRGVLDAIARRVPENHPRRDEMIRRAFYRGMQPTKSKPLQHPQHKRPVSEHRQKALTKRSKKA